MSTNVKQNVVLAVAAITFLLICMFPPFWDPRGISPIGIKFAYVAHPPCLMCFSPAPDPEEIYAVINNQILFIEIVTLLGLTGSLVFLLR